MDLLKELAVSSAKKSRIGKGKREFLTLKDDIGNAILAGYSVKEIWEHLHVKGLVSIKYETFSNYVLRYGLRHGQAIPDPGYKPENWQSRVAKPTTDDRKEKPKKPTGFKHDPSPDKQRLLDG